MTQNLVRRKNETVLHPFWVMVQKEVADHIRSWRFVILLLLMVLTCAGSLYTASMTIRDAVPSSNGDLPSHIFLKLFTVSDNTLPSFITFVAFLGPLLGIGLGFDAINSERNRGTLSRVMSQPIHRDYLINAKFTASLLVVSFIFFGLGFLVMGMGIIATGIPPTPEEFWRVIFFMLLSIVYVAFWLNLAIFLSIRFRQAATSALTGIAIWIFFSIFYSMLVEMAGKALLPEASANNEQVLSYYRFMQFLLRLSPNQLFSEATTTLLSPEVRSLGPLTMKQVYGTIPSLLPLDQSLLLIWPLVTGLVAATTLCFGISYLLFMRQEIRGR